MSRSLYVAARCLTNLLKLQYVTREIGVTLNVANFQPFAESAILKTHCKQNLVKLLIISLQRKFTFRQKLHFLIHLLNKDLSQRYMRSDQHVTYRIPYKLSLTSNLPLHCHIKQYAKDTFILQ